MKILLLILTFFHGVLFAASPLSEEIEFRLEPSFSDGTLICLRRAQDGKVFGAVYRLPVVTDGGTENHSRPREVLLKEVPVLADDFRAIAEAIESLQSEAEKSDAVGVDGTSWIFRRKAGGRLIELSFWSPEIRKGTHAYALGARIMAIAQLKDVLPKESDDPHGDIPTVVPINEFKQPKPPNQALQHNDPSCHVPCLRTYRASRGRG
jgi:hypothetical protein